VVDGNSHRIQLITYRYIPIPQEELFDKILIPLYHAKPFEVPQCHALALLLIVFALGALLDADRPSPYTQAKKYYHMARTVLAFDHQTTTSWSIAAFLHIALYHLFNDCDSLGPNAAWVFLGHAVRLGHSIGLRENLVITFPGF